MAMATSGPNESPDSIPNLLYAQTAESKFGGYKLSLLVDPLPSLAANFLLCSKCNCLLRLACSDLIQGQFVCEECSGGVNLPPAMPSRATISELKVRCPLAERGCEWAGSLVGLEVHVTSCVFLKIECRNRCGKFLMRLEMEEHNLTNCVIGEIECEYCGVKTRVRLINEHVVSCQEIPVDCHQCGLRVQRKLLGIHVKDQCPESILVCEFAKYGCVLMANRPEMERHLDESRLEHFQMQILGLESKVLIQEMIIGDMQLREVEKDVIIDDLKAFKDQIMKRVITLEGNAAINPSSVEILILDLSNSFENSVYTVTRETCSAITLGYYEVVYSFSFLSVDMLSLFIEVRKGERDDELEWPLNASCNVSILPCNISGNKLEYPPVEIVQNIHLGIQDEISPIASIDKATALSPEYCDFDSIRVCIKLQTYAPLLKRR